jgi:hypothetical protein
LPFGNFIVCETGKRIWQYKWSNNEDNVSLGADLVKANLSEIEKIGLLHFLSKGKSDPPNHVMD